MSLAKGGSQIRNGRIVTTSAPTTSGTLGCLVHARGDPNTRYILTAAHVIAMNGHAEHGDPIQFKNLDSGKWEKIAEFERSVQFKDAKGLFNLCDAAIARVTNEALVSEEINDIGIPDGVSTGLYQGKGLKFFGTKSGFKKNAEVHSSGNQVPITYRDVTTRGLFTMHFKKQILYGIRSGRSWSKVTSNRDSGALVLDRYNLAVGLHIARTPSNFPVAASVCTPITTVLDELDVELVTTSRGIPSGAAALPDDDAVGESSFDSLGLSIRSLLEPHNSFGGELWQLSKEGLIVSGKLDRTPGRLVTVPRVWRDFGDSIQKHAREKNVPVELIVATICTESSGNPKAFRTEPGWSSDETTPKKVSAGLMQTLISTAQWILGDQSITREVLFNPDKSIEAGTAYIDHQRGNTRLDPPKVACAYNAGSLVCNSGTSNRWKIKQHPIGTGEHADRFVQWFNDCFAFFEEQPDKIPDAPSFWRQLRGR